MQALVISPDNLTAAVIGDLLGELDVDVTLACDIPQQRSTPLLDPYPFIILDWDSPGAEPFCRNRAMTRRVSPAVIVAVTRHRRDSVLRSTAIAGADDCIWLAMEPDLLTAKLAAAKEQALWLERDRLTEHSLQQSDARFRSLVEHAPDMITILNAEGRIQYVSPAVSRLLGYPEGSLLDQDVFTFVHLDDLAATRAAFAHLMEQRGEPISTRFRLRHLDGSWRWLETTGINAMHDGSVGGIIANSRDVTDQLATEAQLHKSIERQRDCLASATRQAQELELLEHVRVALAREMDLGTVIRTAVEATANVFGYRLVSVYLVEDDHLLLQHQCGYDQVISRVPVAKSVSGRVVASGEPLLLKDAHADPDFLAAIEGLISQVCAPIVDQGQVVGTINVESSDGLTLDEDDLRLVIAISEHMGIAVARARLFDEARTSDARFHAAFNSAPAGTALILEQGEVLRVNDALGAILGHSPAALGQENFLSFVRGHDRTRLRRRIQRLLRSESTQEHVELVMVHASGRQLWASLGISCVRGSKGTDDYFIVQVQDTTERKALVATLEHQASHDPLTELPNRTSLTEKLERAIRTGSEEVGAGHYALLLIDLDGFKLINDSFGHEAGDAFLVAAARRLQNALRADDVIARLGGDEFAVLLTSVTATGDAKQAADRLLQALKAPFRVSGKDAFISASIGIAVGKDAGASPAGILRQADVALYRAKAAGRGTTVAFHPRMTAPVPSGLSLERELQEAISAGRVEVAYQPQVDLRTGRIVGVEALARMSDAADGRFLPSEFLPLAERTGLIVPMGWEVLERACLAWRDWSPPSRQGVPVLTVNFSAQQLQQPEIESRIATTLERTGMDPACLQIEVPERSWAVDPALATGVIERLRAMGIRFAIDDFGAEVASLLHLLTPHIDAVSISPALLANLRAQRGGLGFIRSLGALAHQRGLILTAKAIETRDQLAVVRALEIDQGQGYFLAPPMSSSQLSAHLAEDHRLEIEEIPLHLLSGELSSLGA